ncbi:MAG TPA: SPFH domain-containing protein, partial [Stenotrophomonas sp.]
MKQSVWIAAAVVVLLGLMGSVFVVREDQTAMVLNLGRVARADIKPGLHFKIPLIETARVFDRRFQVLDTAPARYFTAEQKDVSVD